MHVYKTGGVSVEEAIRQARPAGVAQILRDTIGKRIGRRVTVDFPLWKARVRALPQHASARTIRDAMPSRVFGECFKFGFVRNPWSLQLSLYHYMRRSEDHPQRHIIRALPDFQAYIEWIGTRPNGRHGLQCDFLMDEKGASLMDFVGRFERLADDYAIIARKFGWSPSLPHMNRSTEGRDYRTCYTPRMRDIVADLHRPDIEAFGYEFEAQCGLDQPAPNRVFA